MRSPHTATKSSPLSLQLKKSPHNNKDPAQPKHWINKNYRKKKHPHEWVQSVWSLVFRWVWITEMHFLKSNRGHSEHPWQKEKEQGKESLSVTLANQYVTVIHDKGNWQVIDSFLCAYFQALNAAVSWSLLCLDHFPIFSALWFSLSRQICIVNHFRTLSGLTKYVFISPSFPSLTWKFLCSNLLSGTRILREFPRVL